MRRVFVFPFSWNSPTNSVRKASPTSCSVGSPIENAARRVEGVGIEVLLVEGFEPRSGVHRVAMHVVFETLRGADAAAGHGARQHPDAHADERPAARGMPAVELDDALLDGERAAHGVDGVLADLVLTLARDRRPERRHDGIAEEPQDHAMVLAHQRRRGFHELVEPVHQGLRLEAFGHRGEVHHVGEKNRGRQPLRARAPAARELLALLPQEFRQLRRHEAREKAHQLRAFPALAARDVRFDQRGGADPGERGRHERNPPSVEE